MFLILFASSTGYGQSVSSSRQAAEYCLEAYANHYEVPLEFARAVVEQESGWQVCAMSAKGALGIMQLMPQTAVRLGVRNRCDLEQNISGGIRYLAWLMVKFHGEMRLVAAAYYAGEHAVGVRGLAYANPEVVAYVASIRRRVERKERVWGARQNRVPRRAQ
jgi:soluble lytic murein transglycosylase-like protein